MAEVIGWIGNQGLGGLVWLGLRLREEGDHVTRRSAVWLGGQPAECSLVTGKTAAEYLILEEVFTELAGDYGFGLLRIARRFSAGVRFRD